MRVAERRAAGHDKKLSSVVSVTLAQWTQVRRPISIRPRAAERGNSSGRGTFSGV